MADQHIARPSGWSDRAWADLERLIRARPDWLKPAHHPEMFGLTSSGVALAAYLLDSGCLPGTAMPEDGTMTTTVPIKGRTVLAFFGPRPALVEQVAEVPDTPAAWRALAVLEVVVGSRRVWSQDGVLTVEFALPFHRSSRRDVLDDLSAEVGRLRNAMESSHLTRGGGYADMMSAFVAAELAVPALPAGLQHRLRRVDEWCWTTRRYDARGRLDDYLMESCALLGRAIDDHVTISHGGHGIASYALTWRMAFGPLAFVVQDGWGGWGGGPRNNGALAELFAQAAALVRAAEARMSLAPAPPTGAWMRPVVVACSPLRGILSCRIWDPVRGERRDVKLDPESSWAQIEHLVETSWVPDMSAIGAVE